MREDQKVAVIGIGLRFPEADNLDQFYHNLTEGKDSVRPISDRRKALLGFSPEKDLLNSGWVEGIDNFDYRFFNISKREAVFMNPEHRMLLKLACEAIWDANYSLEELSNSETGVYLGGNPDLDYGLRIDEEDPLRIIGNSPSLAASRISHFMNLRGPAMMIDTTCSSSSVAIHQAVSALVSGDIEMAIAGGAYTYLKIPEKGQDINSLGIFSEDGKAKAFDHKANGTSGGEGGGLILLKRLDKAIQDGDSIHAIITGSAINHDGKTSNGITAPSPEAQKNVLLKAWIKSQISVDDLHYIEAHGTGTKLGDPIEFKAISDALQEKTDVKKFCSVSALKTNIGHLNNASGVAGVIKAILSLKNSVKFRSLHYNRPNPLLELDNSGAKIQTENESWNTTGKYCGVSSFGLSGTNAHIVLEAAKQENLPFLNDGELCLKISAKTIDSLESYSNSIENYLRHSDDQLIAHQLHALNTGRDDFSYRTSFHAKDKTELLNQLKQRNYDRLSPVTERQVVFLAGNFDLDITSSYKEALGDALQIAAYQQVLDSTRGEISENLRKFAFQYACFSSLQAKGVKLKTVIGTGMGRLLAQLFSKKINLDQAVANIESDSWSKDPLDEKKFRGILHKLNTIGHTIFIDFSTKSDLSVVAFDELNEGFDVRIATDFSNSTGLVLDLYQAGVAIDWKKFYNHIGTAKLRVPLYTFDDESCWYFPKTNQVKESVKKTENTIPSNKEKINFDSIELHLIALWQELLEMDDISVDDDFFDLGGHSLNGIKLINEVNATYNTLLQFEDLYEYATIEQLAEFIGDSTENKVEQGIPVLDEQPFYKATSAQKLFWLQAQHESTQYLNNIVGAALIKGEFDISNFEKACLFVINRHEVLRTVFKMEGSELRQIVLPDLSGFTVLFDDLSSENPDDNAEKKLVQDAILTEFDLDKGPLLKINLFKTASERYIVSMVLHHIIADDWSVNILTKELFENYQLINSGSVSTKEPLKVQFRDYSAWYENKIDQSNLLEEQVFWHKELSDSVANQILLPYDFNRSEKPSFEGNMRGTILNKTIADQLRGISKTHNVTLFTTLMAIVNMTINYFSSQSTINIGIPVSGRIHKDIEPLIGLFLNNLVIKTEIAENKSFDELLSHQHDKISNAMAHQSYPYERLVSELQAEGTDQKNALYDIMVVMLTNSAFETSLNNVSGIENEEVKISNFPVVNPVSKLDITFFFIEKESIELNIEYATDLFREETIDKILEVFQKLTERIITNTSESINALQANLIPETGDFYQKLVEHSASQIDDDF